MSFGPAVMPVCDLLISQGLRIVWGMVHIASYISVATYNVYTRNGLQTYEVARLTCRPVRRK